MILGLILIEFLSFTWINYGLKHFNHRDYINLKIIDRNIFKWQSHHYLNYIPRPNHHIIEEKDGNKIYSHNSLGFRGKEFKINKPSNTYRIVMIGGSAVYSSRVALDKLTIPARLEDQLKNMGYQNVEVINGGVSGYGTSESLINLQFRILELSPDLVILYEAINDLHNRYVPPELFFADNRGRLKSWDGYYFPFWAKSNLGRIVAFYTGYLNKYLFIDNYISASTYLGHTQLDHDTKPDSFYKNLLRKNGSNFFKQNIISIYGILKIRNIPFVISTYGYSLKIPKNNYLKNKMYLSGLLEMNTAIRDTAKEYKIPLIDYALEMPDGAEYWRDEVHVTKNGALKSAEIFSKNLVKLIALEKK